MILVESLTSKIARKLKKILFISSGLIATVVLLSPYLVNFYVEQKFNALIKSVSGFNPGIKIVSHIDKRYLQSVFITKIQLDPQMFVAYATDYKFNNQVTLRHDVSYGLHKKLLATITTTVLDGDPIFIQDNKHAKVITKLHFNGDLEFNATNLEINRNIDGEKNYYLLGQDISVHVFNSINDSSIKLHIPKLIYNEKYYKTEIDGLSIKLAVQKTNKIITQPKINFSTIANKIYLLEKSTPILRVADFSLEQNLEEVIDTKLTFLKLNILDQKYGPCSSKFQLNNINLLLLLDKFKQIKFPIMIDQLNQYKFIEVFNEAIKYNPYLTADLLLTMGNDKLKLVTDFIVDSATVDWFNLQDVLNSLSAHITANIPKAVLIDFIAHIMYRKQKNQQQQADIYNPVNKANNKLSAMPKTKVVKDPEELENQLNDMVLEKLAYLIENNIIQEKENGFDLDLSIADGVLYSKMNPFRVFSY